MMIVSMVVFLITGMLLPLLINEFGEVAPWLAGRIVRRAARRLENPEATERYAEEWEATLEEVPGKLMKLLKALDILRNSSQVRQALEDYSEALPILVEAEIISLPARQEVVPSAENLSPAARRMLRLAHQHLNEADEATHPNLRYSIAYLAALRAAMAVVADRGTRDRLPRRGRPRTAWFLLSAAEPFLAEWAEFFAANSDKRAAAAAGLPHIISHAEADLLIQDVTIFLSLIEDTLTTPAA